MDDGRPKPYLGIAFLVGVSVWFVSFCYLWSMAFDEWGLLLGLGLGWIPALLGGAILGAVAGLLWPLLAIGVVLLVIWYLLPLL
jgi:hypothetical protein